MIKHTVERARRQASILVLNPSTDITQSIKQEPNKSIIIHNFFTVDIKNLEGDSF